LLGYAQSSENLIAPFTCKSEGSLSNVLFVILWTFVAEVVNLDIISCMGG